MPWIKQSAYKHAGQCHRAQPTGPVLLSSSPPPCWPFRHMQTPTTDHPENAVDRLLHVSFHLLGIRLRTVIRYIGTLCH
jgi:hypothetical protein